MAEEGRDLTWDAILTASERLTEKHGIEVVGFRRDRWFGKSVQGFLIPKPTATFVAVRERGWRGGWREVQPVASAASAVGRILRLVRAVAAAFATADPVGLLAAGFPEDEYSPEIRDLSERLLQGEALDLRLVAGVFTEWFGDDGGSEPLYTELKRRVDLLRSFP